MKNKNGFTLIELLAAITILGILLVITGVSITHILNGSKENATKIQKETIISAARAYVYDDNITCDSGCSVTVQDLINAGYIEEVDDMPNGNVKITKSGSKYTFTFIES